MLSIDLLVTQLLIKSTSLLSLHLHLVFVLKLSQGEIHLTPYVFLLNRLLR